MPLPKLHAVVRLQREILDNAPMSDLIEIAKVFNKTMRVLIGDSFIKTLIEKLCKEADNDTDRKKSFDYL